MLFAGFVIYCNVTDHGQQVLAIPAEFHDVPGCVRDGVSESMLVTLLYCEVCVLCGLDFVRFWCGSGALGYP